MSWKQNFYLASLDILLVSVAKNSSFQNVPTFVIKTYLCFITNVGTFKTNYFLQQTPVLTFYTFSQVGRLPDPAVGAVDGPVPLKVAEGVREVEARVASVAVGYTSRTVKNHFLKG